MLQFIFEVIISNFLTTRFKTTDLQNNESSSAGGLTKIRLKDIRKLEIQLCFNYLLIMNGMVPPGSLIVIVFEPESYVQSREACPLTITEEGFPAT